MTQGMDGVGGAGRKASIKAHDPQHEGQGLFSGGATGPRKVFTHLYGQPRPKKLRKPGVSAEEAGMSLYFMI